MITVIKSIFAAALLCGALSSSAQTQFTLSGKITGEPGANLFIRYVNSAGQQVMDSCSLQNGTFSIKGNINHPTRLYLTAFKGGFRFRDDSDPNTGFVFVEPGNITIDGTYGHLNELVVKGSRSNDEFISVKNTPKKDVVAKTNSYVAAYYLNLFKSQLKLDSVEKLYYSYTPGIKNSIYGKEIKEYIDKIAESSGGRAAKNFSATDINGKTINLSDFKGHYVLLDFWGSWCVPCRKANPHLISLFNKYHGAGLDVMAIAVDDKLSDWKKAIAKDGTGVWYNIMQEEGAKEHSTPQINDQYNVHSYPSKILVGPDGVIIDRFVGSATEADLDKKLAEIFSK